MARTVVESLGIEFLFKGTQNVKQAKNAEQVVSGLMNGIGKLIGVSGGLYVITGAISRLVQTAEGLYRSAQASNTAVEELDAWGKAVEIAGGNAKAFIGTVQGFTEALVKAQYEGGPMRSMLAELGVATEDSNGKLRDTTAIMLDLAKALEGYSNPEKRTILKNLGFDESAITFMMKGREEMEKMIAEQKRLGVTSKETAERSGRIATSYRKVVGAWRTGVDVILTKLLPAIEKFANKLEEWSIWAVENKDVLEAIFAGVAAVITAVLLPSLLSLAWAMLPVTLVIAAIGALGAALKYLYDDYMTWKTGGVSALGDIWVEWERIALAIGDTLAEMGAWLKSFWDDPKKAWDDAIGYLRNRWSGLSLFEIAQDIFGSLYDGFLNAWNTYIVPFLLAIDKKFEEYFGFSLIDEGKGIIDSLWSGLESAWNAIVPAVSKWINDDFKSIFGINLFGDGKSLISRLWDGLKAGWNSVETWFENKFGFGLSILLKHALGKTFDALVDTMWEKLEAVKTAFGKGPFSGIYEYVKEFNPFSLLTDAIDNVIEALTGTSLTEHGKNFVNAIWEGIKSAWGQVEAWFREKVNEMLSFLPERVRNWMGLNPTAPNENGIDGGAASSLGSKMVQAMEGVNETLKGAADTPTLSPTAAQSATIIERAGSTNNTFNQSFHLDATIHAPGGDPTAMKNGLSGMVRSGLSQAGDAAAYNAESGIGR